MHANPTSPPPHRPTSPPPRTPSPRSGPTNGSTGLARRSTGGRRPDSGPGSTHCRGVPGAPESARTWRSSSSSRSSSRSRTWSDSSSAADMYSVNYCSGSIEATLQQLIENQYDHESRYCSTTLTTRRRSQTNCAALVRLGCDRRSMVQHKRQSVSLPSRAYLSASQYLHTPSLPAEKK
jgi:hypothetical protein